MENCSEAPAVRVVAYFDVDCFYAQAEVLRRPHLQGRPVGVTQKFLVVTCNYEARQRGVPKMASIQAARERCPDLVLFNGEDLTPYRAASKNIMAVLRRFGVLERRGLDEAALDITIEVMKRSASVINNQGFSGHVLGLAELKQNGCNLCFDPNSSDHYLLVGSQLVSEIRAAVERETGFRCSSGIATNKLLAKLVSSVNKPNQQTCILESAVPGFLNPLSVRKLPGIGHQTESLLKDMGIVTVADLQQSTLQQLSNKFGNRLGMVLYNSCRGVDNSLVQDKGPPKSLSVEDSFQPCTSFKQAEGIIKSLAPDLLARLDEDKEEYSRRPKAFTIKWRYPGSWAFRSSSAVMPHELLSASVPKEKRLETVVEIAMKLLSQSLGRQSFSIVVLNIGATSFTSSSNCSNCASHDIRCFLRSPSQSPQKMSLKVVSKREARISREEYEKGGSGAQLAQSFIETIDNNRIWQGLDKQKHIEDMVESQEDVCEVELHEADGCSWELNEFDSSTEQSCRESIKLQPSTTGDTAVSVIVEDQEVPKNASEVASSNSLSGIYNITEGILEAEEFMKFQPATTGHIAASVVGEDQELPKKASEFSPSNPSSGRCNITAGILEAVSLVTRDDERTIGTADPPMHCSNTLVDESLVRDFKSFICKLCGQEIDGGVQSKQEHDDYHYALKLNSQEQMLATLVTSGPSRPMNSKQLVMKTALEHHSSLKRAKIQNESKRTQSGPLDCFFFRSQN